jgi:threonine/homoserine/homoserine lactone efflux protein
MFADEIVNPNALNSTIEFLTAMVTPALLISATGSLVLSTSTRLGRVVDRVRWLEDRLSALIYADEGEKDAVPLYERRVEVVVDLLDKVTSRSRILQRALAAQYYALGFFILCSVTIAVAAFFTRYRWVPIGVGIVGIVFLAYSALLMLRETRMATATVNAEMDFTWELARTVAPENVANKYRDRGRFKGLSTARLKDKHVSKISHAAEDR